MTIADLTSMATEIAQYEKKFRESEARRTMIECEVAVRGYELEAMYQSLLEQEKLHVEKIHMFQQIIDHIPMPILWKDLSGVYLGCNKAYEIETGKLRADVVGKRDEDLYDEDQIRGVLPEELAGLPCPDLFRRSDDIVKVEGTHSYKIDFRTASGQYKPAVFFKSLYYGVNGEPEGIVVFAHTRCDGSLCP